MPPITRILFYDSMFDLLFNLSYFFSGLFTRPEYISYSLYDEKLDTLKYLINVELLALTRAKSSTLQPNKRVILVY